MKNEEAIYRAIGDSSPISLIKACDGYYECPKDAQGKRLGPLVGYAGTDKDGRQFVGDVYANFATIERNSVALRWVAEELIRLSKSIVPDVNIFCGAPEGGKALATALSLLDVEQKAHYIFPEKKVIAVATATSREISKLVFSRHEPAEKELVAIVEDVCNNFSTTETLIRLIEQYGARCVAIICFLNRSDKFEETYPHQSEKYGSLKIPIISLVAKPLPEYRQNDPEVQADIEASNVVWKPKNDWPRLMAAMEK